MKCKCCNIDMKWRDFKMLQDDGTEEDMCGGCLNIAYYPEFYDFEHYTFSDITEALIPFDVTPVKKCEY